jgi:hypothetical protein
VTTHLETLLGELPEHPERAAALASRFGRDQLERQARLLGLMPVLVHYLPGIFALPHPEELAARFRAVQHLRATLSLSRLLADAGIRAIVLKGSALASRLYPEPWIRGYQSDVDLLVHPRDFDGATRLLEKSGWRIAIEFTGKRLDFGHDRSLIGPGRVLLELHFTPSWHFQARFDADALFDRARAQELEGEQVLVLDPADQLVHLCVHAGAHGFEGLKWLFDVKLAALRDAPPWERFIDFARRARVAAASGTALAEAKRRVQAPVPGWVLESLRPGLPRRALGRLGRKIPRTFARTRSFVFDLVLADRLSKAWVLRLVAPPVKRVSRALRWVASVVWRHSESDRSGAPRPQSAPSTRTPP